MGFLVFFASLLGCIFACGERGWKKRLAAFLRVAGTVLAVLLGVGGVAGVVGGAVGVGVATVILVVLFSAWARRQSRREEEKLAAFLNKGEKG